jgi:hypothetical protein
LFDRLAAAGAHMPMRTSLVASFPFITRSYAFVFVMFIIMFLFIVRRSAVESTIVALIQDVLGSNIFRNMGL